MSHERRRCEMNWDQVEANWKEYQGRARRKWGKLTDDDWQVVQGDRKILEGKLQERYGHKREQAEREVNEWIESL